MNYSELSPPLTHYLVRDKATRTGYFDSHGAVGSKKTLLDPAKQLAINTVYQKLLVYVVELVVSASLIVFADLTASGRCGLGCNFLCGIG